MNKFIAVVLLLAFSTPSLADNSYKPRDPLPVEQCAIHAPFGVPSSDKQLKLICRQAYLVGYDASKKIPQFVSWTLTPPTALGCWPRTDAFKADPSIAAGSVPDDYANTGYDKGHLAPEGDQNWSRQVEWESFLMTNISPQAPSLNRGIWKLLETSFRGWTVQYNRPFTAIAGTVYSPENKTIGNGVVVPHAFFKVVIDDQTGMVAAWYFPHTSPYPKLGTNLTKYRVSIAAIQRETGIIIPLPNNAQEVPIGKEWTVNFGALTNAKRIKCSKGPAIEKLGR